MRNIENKLSLSYKDRKCETKTLSFAHIPEKTVRSGGFQLVVRGPLGSTRDARGSANRLKNKKELACYREISVTFLFPALYYSKE